MSALPDGVDITAAFGGSITSHREEPMKQSLLKWKQQVKNMTTRITVVRRFTRTYRAKSFQCSIPPGSTAASPQKSNTSEGSKTRNLSSGALFIPKAAQDAPKQKFNPEKKNREGFSFKKGDVFKDHCTLSPIQILLTVLNSQILKDADLLGWRIIVTVIGLDPRQEGTTASYNHIVRTVLKGLLLLLCLGNFEKSDANAQADSEDRKLERSNERTVDDLPYNVQLVAWTVVAGIFTMAIIYIAARINRRPLVPVTAAAPLAGPPPAAAPLAGPPAVPVLAIPIGFINVMDGLEDPNPARISNPDFNIWAKW